MACLLSVSYLIQQPHQKYGCDIQERGGGGGESKKTVRYVIVAKNGDKTKRRMDVESYIFSSIEVLRMKLASKRTTVVAVEDILKEWY
jgi:hypothetical protein